MNSFLSQSSFMQGCSSCYQVAFNIFEIWHNQEPEPYSYVYSGTLSNWVSDHIQILTLEGVHNVLRKKKHTPNKFKVKMQSSKTRPSLESTLQAPFPFPLQNNITGGLLPPYSQFEFVGGQQVACITVERTLYFRVITSVSFLKGDILFPTSHMLNDKIKITLCCFILFLTWSTHSNHIFKMKRPEVQTLLRKCSLVFSKSGKASVLAFSFILHSLTKGATPIIQLLMSSNQQIIFKEFLFPHAKSLHALTKWNT